MSNLTQPGSAADADTATLKGAATVTGPGVGSIWRERDNRFERLVRIVRSPSGNMCDPRVGIATISFNMVKPPRERVTYAKASAFGSRYLFVSAGAPTASTTDAGQAVRDDPSPLPPADTGKTT